MVILCFDVVFLLIGVIRIANVAATFRFHAQGANWSEEFSEASSSEAIQTTFGVVKAELQKGQ